MLSILVLVLSTPSNADRQSTRFYEYAVARFEVGDYEGAELQLRTVLSIDPDHLLTLPVTRRIRRMGEEIANDALQDFDALAQDLDAAFAALTPARQAAAE